ncbi:MAG: glycosyltransferase, partial [Planctomyces sp.]
MLQALLPQVSQFPGQVEVWVLDNASTDKTDQVLAESVVLGPFRVHRQHQNIGPTRNIVCGPATLANGEYVWVLGDHNLLRPGALSRLLT